MEGTLQFIRQGAKKVAQKSKDCKISKEGIAKLVAELKADPSALQYVDWADCDFHYFDKNEPETVADYIFVLDSLNFCFWPHTWEYDNLATSLKNILLKDKNAFKPKNLIQVTFEDFKRDFFSGIDFPLLNERFRVIKELASQCLKYYDGEFSNIIKKANNISEDLVDILTRTFRNLQDHAIYDGEQIVFYKRAQILVADLWGAFKGAGYGKFNDIEKITMFADYRVPQILAHLNVLVYSEELEKKIRNRVVLPHGGTEEVEIRANTIEAVELLREELGQQGVNYTSIQIDWLLWQKGEAQKDNIIPHHRTLSIYY